ncbi:MAG: hypothetical protein RR998_08860 [Oscillospiraceae bacterium]
MEQSKKGIKKAVLALLIALLLLGGAAVYLLYPSRYIILDVNPSIGIEMNRLNRVSAVNAVNEDAKVLLNDFEITDSGIKPVMEQLVTRMVESGYLSAESKNDVLLTGYEGSVSQQALQQVGHDLEDTLDKQHLAAKILTQTITSDVANAESAAQHDISEGKMAVIEKLLHENTALTLDDLANARISDLVAYSKESNIPLEELEDRLEDLQDEAEDAAEDAAEIEEKAAEAAREAAEDKREADEEAAEKAREAAKDAADAANDKREDAESAALDAADDLRDTMETDQDASHDAAENAQDD